MDEREYALRVIWKDYSAVSKVNLISGEFIDLKGDSETAEFSDIFAYLESPENLSLVFAHDLHEYKNFINRSTMLGCVSNSSHHTLNYRRNINGRYTWVCFEVIRPKDFSLDNPYVLFTRKDADEKICSERTAVRDLSIDFHKIIQLNLLDDTYLIIKVRAGEHAHSQEAQIHFSSWIAEMLSDGTVHQDDKDVFCRMTDIAYMKKFFCERKGNLRVRYRRWSNDQWRWVVFEVIPSPDFNVNNQIVTAYIRDIEDEYSEQMQHQKSIEKICFEDALTGIQNRMSYGQEISGLKQMNTGSIGIIYADLNGLKYMNDTYGHSEGDNYIKTFANFLRKAFRSSSCYRIGGDEFVVILKDIPHDVFEQRVLSFEKSTLDLEETSVAIGSCWGCNPSEIEFVVQNAEKQMYRVKQEFHRLNPEMKRL